MAKDQDDSLPVVLPSDFEGATKGALDFVLLEAEKRLASQMTLFAMGDTRAIGILAASVTLGAAGVALAGFGLQADKVSLPLVAMGTTGVLTTSAAAIFALRALRPEPTYPPGWYPSQLASDIKKKKTLIQMKSEAAAHFQTRLTANKRTKGKLDGSIKAAMLTLALAPLLALIVGGLASGTPIIFCFLSKYGLNLND